MEEIPYIKQEVLLIQFENSYRKCNVIQYKTLLSEKFELLPEETINILHNPDKLFYTSFIRDLLNPDLFIDTNNVIKIYLNLKSKEKLTVSEATILCCLCLKIEDYDYMNSILAEVGNDINEGDLWLIKATLARRKNRNLAKIQANFAAGHELSSKDLETGNDIGLSVLHYTLMLRNKELILRLLPAFNWQELRNPFSNIPMINAIYDPMFLASNLFKDYGLLTKIFKYTSSKAVPINKSIKRLDAMIDINTALKKKNPDNKAELLERISDLRGVRRDLKEELKSLAKSEVIYQRRMATLIRETGHIFCNYLLDLFLGENGFADWIQSTKKDYCISKYKDVFFVTNPKHVYNMSSYTFSQGIVIDTNVLESDRIYSENIPKDSISGGIKYYENPAFRDAMEEERRRQEREKQRRKEEFRERVKCNEPYQGGWFSKLARKNIQTLKAEYRVLVKKYHPDSSKDNKTTKVFMRIMAERAEILDAMMKNS